MKISTSPPPISSPPPFLRGCTLLPNTHRQASPERKGRAREAGARRPVVELQEVSRSAVVLDSAGFDVRFVREKLGAFWAWFCCSSLGLVLFLGLWRRSCFLGSKLHLNFRNSIKLC